jgi:hypothetical protein
LYRIKSDDYEPSLSDCELADSVYQALSRLCDSSDSVVGQADDDVPDDIAFPLNITAKHTANSPLAEGWTRSGRGVDVKGKCYNSVKDRVTTAGHKLECHISSVSERVTNRGFPLYEITAIDNIGEDATIYLWFDSPVSHTPFHQRWDQLIAGMSMGIKALFYHLVYDDVTVDKLTGKKGYFKQTSKTFIVLLPDFLVDNTSIAECFQSKGIYPELFFMKFIRASDYATALFKGSFVNDILDTIISGGELNLDELLLSSIKKDMLKYSQLTTADIADILSEVEGVHLENLLQTAKHFTNERVSIEPSFISADYGIQGRLDALIESDDNATYKTVFELKSGSAPAHSTWSNHYAQIMGYNLLLESVFGDKRTGHSMVLYSGAEKDALRNVTYSEKCVREIMMCRNLIVSMILHLTHAPLFQKHHPTFTDYLSSLHGLPLPTFIKSDIQSFLDIYEPLADHEKIYYHTQIVYLLREMMAKKVGHVDGSGAIKAGFSALWNKSIREKIAQKTVLTGLRLVSYTEHTFTFSFETHEDTLAFEGMSVENTPFREGDIVVLYPAITCLSRSVVDEKLTESFTAHSAPCKVPIFRAIIKHITASTLTIIFINQFITATQIQKYIHFYAEYDYMENTAYNTPTNFLNFISLPAKKRDILLGMQAPRFDGISEAAGAILDRILQKANTMQDYLLVQGPPGTGKTSKYLIEIVKQYLQSQSPKATVGKCSTSLPKQVASPIVILAYTHRALEEIALRLVENGILPLSQADNGKDNVYFMILSARKDIADDGINSIADFHNLLSGTRIFLSTLLNFQKDGSYLAKHFDMDLLIVDEASQILEHQLIGVISLFQKVILIGDHFQLPPISLVSKPFTATQISTQLGITSLADSLFERLYRRCAEKGWTQAFDMLTDHYRMHQDIAKLINPYYDDQLQPYHERQYKSFDKLTETTDSLPPILSHRTVFIHTTERKYSRYNVSEAQKVCEIVEMWWQYLKNDFHGKTLGIICTWKLQVNLISQKLSAHPSANFITVDTVERFQGSERDIIIYSTAVSCPEQILRIQSLTADGQVDRKLNVAISRAKEQFILLGNKDLLSLSPHYTRVMNMMICL